MSRYINESSRKFIRKRADYKCEYCLICEDDTFFSCQIDHVISIKHGGSNEHENLAYSCIYCNRNKGSDLGSILLPNKTLIRFFNPRMDNWSEHFYLDGAVIEPKTDIGKVTVKILELNNVERILERLELQEVGRYPL